jgi:hypothetical protein
VNWKRKFSGSVLALIGFLLSPLSWWNDLFVNFPLAILFARGVAFVYPPAFNASVIIGYWLTNIVGFVLMHKGSEKILKAESKPYSRKTLLKDLLVSLAYTALILLLLKWKIIRPFEEYFPGHAT